MFAQNEVETQKVNKNETQKAIEDIRLIKEIIKKTSLSLISLSRTFIQLGLLMLGVSVLYIVQNYIAVPGINIIHLTLYDVMISIVWLLFFVILPAVVIPAIIKKVIKKNTLQGVSKQLISLWVCMMAFNFAIMFLDPILYALNYWMNPFSTITQSVPIMSVQLFICAMGLVCISVFTKFKFPLVLAIIYILSGLFFLVIKTPIDLYSLILLPVTMVIIGIYLQIIKAGTRKDLKIPDENP